MATATQLLPSFYNTNDNVVNFSDIAAFANVFNTTGALADLNRDGAVNFLVFSIVADYFLSPPGPGGLTGAPESVVSGRR